MPRSRRPGRRGDDFRKPLRNSTDGTPSPSPRAPEPGPRVPEPRPPQPPRPPSEPSSDLSAQLTRLAGTSVAELPLDDASVDAWNAEVTSSGRSSFEHRILLGIALNRRKPSYGKVVDYQTRAGEGLARSARWVQETMRVAGAVDLAIVEGVVLPIEICDLAWSRIPSGIENLRQGRHLRWKPPRERPEPPSQAEIEAAVVEAIETLREALEAIEDPARRAALVAEAVAEIQPLAAAQG